MLHVRLNLKLSCVKMKFESEMRQINLSFVRQFKMHKKSNSHEIVYLN